MGRVLIDLIGFFEVMYEERCIYFCLLMVKYFVLLFLKRTLKYWLGEKMRNILCAMLLLILLGVGVAQAAWQDDFMKSYDKFGMSVAVEDALSDGVSSNEILTFIISNTEQFETKTGLKALYCAGADRDAVREAANKLGITVEDVSVALEESIAECGEKQTLSDRDLMDDQPGDEVGLSDPDITSPPPEPILSPELIEPPSAPRPSSPSAP